MALNRDEAREYFNESGLTYRNVDIARLRMLAAMLNESFSRAAQDIIDQGGLPYWIRMNEARYFKGKYNPDGTMQCAYLTAKGGYFYAREVVSFNGYGFIGFCGEASGVNAEPVIDAFIKWCDWLKEKGERVSERC